MPNGRQRIATLDGSNQTAFLQGVDGVAVHGDGTDNFIVFRAAQDRVTTEQIRHKLITPLHVRKQVLLGF